MSTEKELASIILDSESFKELKQRLQKMLIKFGDKFGDHSKGAEISLSVGSLSDACLYYEDCKKLITKNLTGNRDIHGLYKIYNANHLMQHIITETLLMNRSCTRNY